MSSNQEQRENITAEAAAATNNNENNNTSEINTSTAASIGSNRSINSRIFPSSFRISRDIILNNVSLQSM